MSYHASRGWLLTILLCIGLLCPGQPLFSLSSPWRSAVEYPWQFVTEDKAIRVFSRSVAGSDFKEWQGIMVMNASLEKAVSLLTDPSQCEQLYSRCDRFQLLRQVSKTESYVYVVYHVPWPFQNRDAILHCTRSPKPEDTRFTLQCTGDPEYLPEKSQLVRIPEVRARWILQAQRGDALKVTYQSYNDPGGNLGASLATPENRRSLIRTLTNLRELL